MHKLSMIKEKMDSSYVKQFSIEQLPEFCNQIREKLIEIVSRTGGHIGVNLGVVELTVALHYTFDFPDDSLFWDVGHQIYVHKMLTGRLKKLETNRQNEGSPGYSFHKESIYDKVTSSHAGASLSLGLGSAIGNQILKNNLYTISVIGDGSLVEGSSQEALNHIAVENCKMLIILNDNERAIEENFGGLHEYLKKRQIGVEKQETYFSSLEIPYYGPIDGHNVITLVNELIRIKSNLRKPTILHIKTIKGAGLENMLKNSPVKLHWNFKFDPFTGQDTESPRSTGYAKFSGDAIEKILLEDPKAVLITPAVQSSTGIVNAFKKFPDRCYDVSLAEQHAITLGAGFALQGIKPIVCYESTFMQLVFDQIHHDVCINNLPVLIIAGRSGHTGLDHVTHHGLHDLTYLRCIPNLRIIYPATHNELTSVIIQEFRNLKKPTIILYPKADILDDPNEPFIIDNDDLKKSQNSTGLILSVGTQNKNGLEVKHALEKQSIIFDHIAVTNIAPFSDKLADFMTKYDYIITMEEGIITGGFASLISENLIQRSSYPKTLQIGLPKKFIEHGTRDYIYQKYNMDSNSILKKIKEVWPELGVI